MPDQQAPNMPEAVEQISSLLQGQPAGKPAEPTDDSVAAVPSEALSPLAPPADSDSGESGLTPKALAEKLGIKPDELFKTFKIPVDGGEPLTLEEFKKSGKELRGLTAAQHEFAEEKVAFENSVMTQKQTLEKAIAKIPPEALTGEMIAEVQAEHQDTIRRERAALITIRPDLKDPAVWNATRDLLVEHLKPYGFREIEVDSIVDHRLAKYVIDNAERGKRLKELDVESLQLDKPTKLAAPSARPRAPSKRVTGTTGDKQTKGVKTNQTKAAEIAQLLGTPK